MAPSRAVTVVRAFPRLHFTLVDLGDATARRYGGSGCMLNCLPVQVSVERGRREVIGSEALDDEGRRDVLAAIQRFEAATGAGALRVAISGLPPQHVGLGTKTALLLAVLKGCSLHAGKRLSAERLQTLSGRGGTSGVGIHGFFTGGCIVDVGHPATLGEPMLPSGSRVGHGIPCLAARLRVPDSWRFAAILPKGRRFSGSRELAFFRENTPLPKPEVYEALALVHHGVVPAIREDNLELMRRSLAGLHRCGFKARELAGQPDCVRDLYRALSELRDSAVGLSSLGPLLYVVMKSPSRGTVESLAHLCEHNDAALVCVCKGRNRGFEVST